MPPNSNTQDVVIHFLEDKFISCPCCALCAFDVMYFLTRTTGRHESGFPLPPMDGHPPPPPRPEVIGTALVIVISSALSFILFQQRCFWGGRGLWDFLSEILESVLLPPSPPSPLTAPDWLAHFLCSYSKKKERVHLITSLIWLCESFSCRYSL